MAFGTDYQVYICTQAYAKICRVQHTFLQYSDVINAVRQAYFTVQTQDPAILQNGIDLINNIYCVIIENGGVEKFRGEIDQFDTPGNDTPLGVDSNEAYGSLDHIGLYASGIEQKFADLLVVPDTDSDVYKRSFPDGTAIGAAVSALVSEAIAQQGSPVASLIVGNVENPVDSQGAAITIGEDQALYGSNYLDWIQTLTSVGNADWRVRDKYYFDLYKSIGTDRSDQVGFTFKDGFQGNTLTGVTFKVDRRRMATRIIAIGAQDGLNQVNGEAYATTDTVTKFGRRERVIPIRSLDTAATAQSYAESYVQQVSQRLPLDSIQIYPTQDHVLFGNFNIGDTIYLTVNLGPIVFSGRRMRVVGAVVTVEQTGVERIYYSLQEPKD